MSFPLVIIVYSARAVDCFGYPTKLALFEQWNRAEYDRRHLRVGCLAFVLAVRFVFATVSFLLRMIFHSSDLSFVSNVASVV